MYWHFAVQYQKLYYSILGQKYEMEPHTGR